MRWTRVAPKTRAPARGRRSRVVLTLQRRRQGGGGNSAGDGGKPAMVTEESSKETVKTIARGMPGVFRCDRGDYARMLILFCMRGCGRIKRPAFPAPSDVRERDVPAKTRARCAAR